MSRLPLPNLSSALPSKEDAGQPGNRQTNAFSQDANSPLAWPAGTHWLLVLLLVAASIAIGLSLRYAATQRQYAANQRERAEQERKQLEQEGQQLEQIKQAAAQHEREQKARDGKLIQVTLTNKCDKQISLALTYLSPNSGNWLAEGWYNIDPGQNKLVIATKSSYIYYYAVASKGKLVWSAEKEDPDGVDVSVVNEHFAYENGQPPKWENAYTVRLRRHEFETQDSYHNVILSCN